MKRIVVNVIVCVILVSLFTFLIFSDSDAESVTMYGICETGSINVRVKPNVHSDVCGHIEFGWAVDISDSRKVRKTTWYKIDGFGEYGVGWINGRYLSETEPTKTENTYGKVKANGRVAVYSITGKRKGWIKPNKTFQILIYTEERCLTEKGWIKTKYLDIYEGGE